EDGALGDPGGVGDLPRGHRQAVLAQQRYRHRDQRGAALLGRHRGHPAALGGLGHARHCTERVLTQSTEEASGNGASERREASGRGTQSTHGWWKRLAKLRASHGRRPQATSLPVAIAGHWLIRWYVTSRNAAGCAEMTASGRHGPGGSMVSRPASKAN